MEPKRSNHFLAHLPTILLLVLLPAIVGGNEQSESVWHVLAVTTLKLGALVVFALVVQALLAELPGITHPAALGFIELTGGVVRLGSSPSDFVWAATLLGWGGLSVHGQTAAVLAGTGLRMDRYFLGKLLQAAVSAVLAYMTVRFFA